MSAYRLRTRCIKIGLAHLTLASLCAGAAAAQTVQGRVVELGDREPVAGALIALVDSAGGEVARGATSPSGGFVLAAGRSCQQPWRSAPFALAAGATYPVTFHIEVRPYELPTLTVEASRSRCGARPGESGTLGALLDAADVALQLARTTTGERRLAFSTATYVKVLDPNLRVLDSASTGVTRLAPWPIESADPDSLRAWGFVRQPSSSERATTADVGLGPIYYGPDARVLSATGSWPTTASGSRRTQGCWR